VNRIASKSWLYAKIVRKLIAKTLAESLSENDLIRRPPKSTKSKSIWRRRLQGDWSYIRHVVGKLKHLHRLKYQLAHVSAGKLSTPETWARDTGTPVTGVSLGDIWKHIYLGPRKPRRIVILFLRYTNTLTYLLTPVSVAGTPVYNTSVPVAGTRSRTYNLTVPEFM